MDVEELDRTFAMRMQRCVDNDDTEDAHCNADNLLIELLRSAGFNKTADAWQEVDKWYA